MFNAIIQLCLKQVYPVLFHHVGGTHNNHGKRFANLYIVCTLAFCLDSIVSHPGCCSRSAGQSVGQSVGRSDAVCLSVCQGEIIVDSGLRNLKLG